MLHSTPLVLAAGDWIALLVFLGITAISILGQVAKQRGKAGPTGGSPAPPQTTSAGGDDLDRLAAERRRQLTELARRRQQPGPPAPGAEARPTNLTMEQLRQREQARIEYERRAAALRQQYQARQQAGRPVGPPPQPAPPRPSPLRPVQPRPALRRPAPARPVSRPRPPVEPAIPVLAPAEAGTSAAPRAAALPVAPPSRSAGGRRRAILRLDGKALALSPRLMRHAVVLHEILRPPVALR